MSWFLVSIFVGLNALRTTCSASYFCWLKPKIFNGYIVPPMFDAYVDGYEQRWNPHENHHLILKPPFFIIKSSFVMAKLPFLLAKSLLFNPETAIFHGQIPHFGHCPACSRTSSAASLRCRRCMVRSWRIFASNRGDSTMIWRKYWWAFGDLMTFRKGFI